jgi:hypothetical protein
VIRRDGDLNGDEDLMRLLTNQVNRIKSSPNAASQEKRSVNVDGRSKYV